MLTVKNISFQYSPNEVVFTNLSFTINSGEIVALVGPSGCGKTTLLKLIYGLLPLNSGAILWRNKQVPHPADVLIAGEKHMKLVEQDFNLMPFTNVYENILHHVLHIYDDDRQPILDYWLNFLNISAIEHKKAAHLSGGQMQRVAMAKSLISKPELLLLDEPFSNLDTRTKSNLIHDLKTHLKQTNTTALVVVHQPEDALEMADKIMVLDKGNILQYTDPKTLYNQPNAKLVADLFGVSNVIDKHVFKEITHLNPSQFHHIGHHVVVRAHQINLTHLKGKINVQDELFLGQHTLLKVNVNGHLVWLNK